MTESNTFAKYQSLFFQASLEIGEPVLTHFDKEPQFQ